MIGWIIVLYLYTYDGDTGILLHEYKKQMPTFSITGDIENDCRKDGLSKAYALTDRYRKKFPFAFTNIKCRWERKEEDI